MIKINIPQSKLDLLVDKHWKWFESHLSDMADWFEDAQKNWNPKNIISRQDFIIQTLKLKKGIDDIKHIIQASFQEMKDIISNHPQWTFPKKKGTDYKLRDAIQRAFGYKDFTDLSNKGWTSLKLFDKLHLTVCPYCNSERIGVLTNKGKYNYKTPMDHFFPESKYPALSCSFYNIIPACTMCNSLKRDFDTYIYKIVYPHLEEFGKDALFRCKFDLQNLFSSNSLFNKKIEKKIRVTIKPPTGKKLPNQIKNSVEKLDIESVYTDLHQNDVKEFICNCRSSIPIRVKFFARFGFNKDKILKKLHPYQRSKGHEYPFRKFEEDVLDQVKEFL